jgi:hypothetical protein
MKLLRGDRWRRRGVTILWDTASLRTVASPDEVLTLRQFVALSEDWPEELPGQGDALVVAGLKGALEVLSAEEGRAWLEDDLRKRILSFQKHYEGLAALILWFPAPKAPLVMSPADENYTWTPPHSKVPFPLGRCLWTGTERDVERIITGENLDPDGPGWVGLTHIYLS